MPRRLLWRRLALRLGLALGVGAALTFALPLILPPLLPFGCALILTWLLNPAVDALLARGGGSRALWSAVLLVGLLLAAGGFLFFLCFNAASELRELAETRPDLLSRTARLLTPLTRRVEEILLHLPRGASDWCAGALDTLQETFSRLLSDALAAAGNAVMKLPSLAVGGFVFLLACFFMTSDYPRLRALAIRRMTPGVLGGLRFLRRTAGSALGGFFKAQFLLSCGVFLLLLFGFSLAGQAYAFLLSLLLAALDFIPLLGAGIVLLPWGALRLLTGEIGDGAALLALWGATLLFRHTAEPRVVGAQTGLSPLSGLFGLYAGMKLAGVWGLFLGPALLSVGITLCRSGLFDPLFTDLKWAASELSLLLKSSK